MIFKKIKEKWGNTHNILFKKCEGSNIIFEFWFNKANKQISLINYKKSWSKNGTGKIYRIRDNGGRRKNKDKCFDFYIEFGYFVFNYTNFSLCH